MANASKYRRIYNKIAAIRCSEEQLHCLKSRFAGVINSNRRLESIGTIQELLHVLEKRNCLNPDETEPLQEIAKAFGDRSTLELFRENGFVDNNAVVHNNRLEQPVINLAVPRDLRDKMYRCIATDIGQKWVAFARVLEVPEGQIDTLNANTDLTNRVYQVFRYHEENCDPRTWLTKLLDGLTDARRNDLRKKVQHIIDVSF